MLTPSQNLIVRAYIESIPYLNNQGVDGDGLNNIRDALNAVASPDYIVWRTKVTLDEIMQNGFDWTRADNLSVGKARCWEWMFSNQNKAINPAKANVRTGIESVWVGTAADLAVRAAVYVHCKRPATVLEKLLATGTGTTADPATLGFEGEIDSNGVDTARRFA